MLRARGGASGGKSPHPPLLSCIDRGHSGHMFGDMVDTIMGMILAMRGGHALERGVQDVPT